MKTATSSLQLVAVLLIVLSMPSFALSASSQVPWPPPRTYATYDSGLSSMFDDGFWQKQQESELLTPMAAITGAKLVPTHSFGGSTWAVTGNGNRLYYNAGADLVIADVTNPIAPVELGRWIPVDKASFSNIQVAGSLVYIPHMFTGVEIVETSNPSQPTLVGNIPIRYIGGSANAISRVVISGTYAYAIQGKFLRIVDVTTPASPVDSSVITPTGNYLNSLAVSGHYAYVTAGSGGLMVIDVFDPAVPNVIGTLSIPGYAYGVAKQGSYLYVTTNDALQVIDVSIPNTPVQVGIYQPSEFYPSANLAVSGTAVYVQDSWGNELHIVNVSTPGVPTVAGILQLPSIPMSIYVSGSTVYLGTQMDGLAIVRASNPAAPALLGTMSQMSYVRSLSRHGEITYVTAGRTIWAILSQATSLIAMPVFTSTRYIGGISTKGSLAYLAENDESSGASTLEVLNLANSLALQSLGTAPLTIRSANVIAVTGTFAYVGSWQGVSAVNIANPSSPQESSWQAMPSGANVRGIAPYGNMLYVMTTSDLRIYDITTPSTMSPLVTWAETKGSAIAVDGQYAYVPASGSFQGIQILDVSIPSNPTFVKNLNSCGGVSAVAVYGNYLYSLNGCKALQLHDVRDPVNASPYYISWVGLPDHGQQVVIDGDKVLVADNGGGFVQAQRLMYSSDYIPVSGGDLASPDGAVTITVRANTYTNTVLLSYEDELDMTTGDLKSGGRFFVMTAYYTDTGTLASLSPGQSFTVTLSYLPSIVRQDTLGFYRLDGTAWTSSGISSTVDTLSRQLTAHVTTFSGDDTFALLGQSYSIYLPLVLKNRGGSLMQR